MRRGAGPTRTGGAQPDEVSSHEMDRLGKYDVRRDAQHGPGLRSSYLYRSHPRGQCHALKARGRITSDAGWHGGKATTGTGYWYRHPERRYASLSKAGTSSFPGAVVSPNRAV